MIIEMFLKRKREPSRCLAKRQENSPVVLRIFMFFIVLASARKSLENRHCFGFAVPVASKVTFHPVIDVKQLA